MSKVADDGGKVRTIAITGLLLGLGGCGSDFGLGNVPAGDTDATDGAPDRDDPDGGDGPWGHLDPGQWPDVYFAVAWSASDLEPCNDDYFCTDDVRYAVIDLRGQVIAELDLPYSGYEKRHLSIEPAGPGQFTVAAEVWPIDPADDEGWNVASSWETWRGDAVTGAIERTAHREWDGSLVLDGASAALDLGAAARVHVGTWPGEPDRALWLAAGSRCGPGALEGLRSVHLSDAAAPIEAWAPADLVPLGMEEALPFAFEAGEDLEGAPSAMVAIETGDCGFQAGYTAIQWSPGEGVLWSSDLGPDLYPREVTWAAYEGGAVLSMFAGESPGWRLDGPNGTRGGDIPVDIVDAHPGPVLEPSSGTFILRGRSPATAHDALVIVHEGAVVWTIDQLKFGLGKESVFLRDVVLLPPAP